ncbi:putative F-box protein At3g10240 isoform X1 [Primulina eburnea]|uniref:putative F-box protein At3g10240 isoform X1 n=1 Tax=Primulina eburnea TaxID=1245227 RepID=UPI003C6C7075
MWSHEKMWPLGGFEWAELPEDLKVEILCRLQSKALMRLKCVSKSWYFLISYACAPMKSSLSRSATFCGFFYTHKILRLGQHFLDFLPAEEYSGEFYPRYLPEFPGLLKSRRAFLPFEDTPSAIQSYCNGLFLLVRSGSNPTEYIVCNPTTCEYIELPINPHHTGDDNDPHVASLAFDPSDSTISFKVVRRAADVSLSHPIKLDLFTSDSGNWATRVLVLDHVLHGFNWIDHSVYVNGLLYVISLAKYLLGFNLRFTTKTDITHLAIELPHKEKFDDCGSFGTSRWCVVYSINDKSKILVWRLEHGVHWILQHIVSFDEMVSQNPQHKWLRWLHNMGEIKVYSFHPKSEVIFVGTPRLVLQYSPNTKQLKIFRQFRRRREIMCGQYKMYPSSCCPVILNGVLSSSRKGGYGRVFECRHKLDGITYAVKKIPFNEDNEDQVIQEVKIMAQLHHPNIVRYHQVICNFIK